MKIQPFIATDRLTIKPLTVNDYIFILELVNTEGWIQFIGNRNITSDNDATAYIQKILANQNIVYWVVSLKISDEAIGIITFIKRDYLEHPDIGFAFLPAYTKKGYAFEATNAVFNYLIEDQKLTHILATTIPENIRSISLLKKLGLAFEKEMEVEKQKLHIYGTPTANIKSYR